MTTKQEYNMILNESVKLKDILKTTEINNKRIVAEVKTFRYRTENCKSRIERYEKRNVRTSK